MDKERKDHLIQVSDINQERQTELGNTAYRSMNNIIFVLSTGSFVLTISLIGYLKNYITHSYFLLISWCFLFLSITFNFLAHFVTAKIAERSFQLVNEERAHGFPYDGDFNKKIDTDDKIKKYRFRAKITTYVVLTSLPFAIITLIIFSWLNLISQNKINELNQNKPNTENITNR